MASSRPLKSRISVPESFVDLAGEYFVARGIRVALSRGIIDLPTLGERIPQVRQSINTEHPFLITPRHQIVTRPLLHLNKPSVSTGQPALALHQLSVNQFLRW